VKTLAFVFGLWIAAFGALGILVAAELVGIFSIAYACSPHLLLGNQSQ
jgi:hypothetical protein